VPRDVPGEPSAFNLFALVAPTLGEMVSKGGFALPDPEPVVLGAAYPWDATAAEIRGLRRVCEAHGLAPPLSQKEFIALLMRVCWTDRAALAAFQLPLEIGRLQVRWARAAREPGRGGIVMTLATVPGEPWRRQPLCDNGEIEDPDFPRIVILPIDARRSRIWFKPVPGTRRAGVFVSLQPLAEAMSGERLDTLGDACEAFEIDRVPSSGGFKHALAEIRTESRLYRTLLEQHVALCPDEPPTAYASPGTYAKAMLRQAGLRPALQRWPDFPRDVLAATMAAYYGGEVTVHVRGTKLPARLLDFGGAFGIAGTLIGAWEMCSAGEVVVEEIPLDEAVELLRRLASDFRAYVLGGPPPSPDAWQAAWITVFLPPRAHVLPHRPRQGESWITTRAPLTYRKGELPWQAPDILVHLLEGGDMPPITRAFRLVPKGRASLRPLTLPTGRRLDPSREDLIGALGDERARARHDLSLSWHGRRRLRGLLKGVTVSTLSGLPIQINDDEPTKELRPQQAFNPKTGEPTLLGVEVLETPGDWYWTPLAAAVTTTARLLLHLVIESVHAAGGIVAYWDTDSVLVVALPEGGLVWCPGGPERTPGGREAIRALSFAQVEEIRRRVDRLLSVPGDTLPHVDVWGAVDELPAVPEDTSPYVDLWEPPGMWMRVPDARLLEVEPANFDGPSGSGRPLYAAPRASKKYHLYRPEPVHPRVKIVDGIPVLVDPTAEAASRPRAIRVAWASEHGLPYEAPESAPSWVSQGIEHVLRIEWESPNANPDWWDRPAFIQVPASRCDVLERHPNARPFCRVAVAGIALAGQVVAPMHRSFDPHRADWRDAEEQSVRTNLSGYVILQTLGDALLRAWNAFDRRTVAPDGQPVGRGTKGITTAFPSIAGRVRAIGKESRGLGIGRGVLHRPEFLEYGGDDDLTDVIEAAGRLSKESAIRTQLREAVGVEERAFAYWLSARRKPGPEAFSLLTSAVAEAARSQLRQQDAFGHLPESELDVIAAFLDLPEPESRCLYCGKALSGRARKWCPGDVCRKRFERSEQERLDL
jgi:hypothetical protein